MLKVLKEWYVSRLYLKTDWTSIFGLTFFQSDPVYFALYIYNIMSAILPLDSYFFDKKSAQYQYTNKIVRLNWYNYCENVDQFHKTFLI